MPSHCVNTFESRFSPTPSAIVVRPLDPLAPTPVLALSSAILPYIIIKPDSGVFSPRVHTQREELQAAPPYVIEPPNTKPFTSYLRASFLSRTEKELLRRKANSMSSELGGEHSGRVGHPHGERSTEKDGLAV